MTTPQASACWGHFYYERVVWLVTFFLSWLAGEWLLTCIALLNSWGQVWQPAQIWFYNFTSLVTLLFSANFPVILSGSRKKPSLLLSFCFHTSEQQLPLLNLLMLLLRAWRWGPAWAVSCVSCSSPVDSCAVGLHDVFVSTEVASSLEMAFSTRWPLNQKQDSDLRGGQWLIKSGINCDSTFRSPAEVVASHGWLKERNTLSYLRLYLSDWGQGTMDKHIYIC